MAPPRFWGIGAQGMSLWFPAHFLNLRRWFPISVWGGTVQQTLALNFKMLVPPSSQRGLLGSKALSISGSGTVGSVPFIFKLAWPFSYCYLPMDLLIIACYWVNSGCKALEVQFKTSVGHSLPWDGGGLKFIPPSLSLSCNFLKVPLSPCLVHPGLKIVTALIQGISLILRSKWETWWLLWAANLFVQSVSLSEQRRWGRISLAKWLRDLSYS